MSKAIQPIVVVLCSFIWWICTNRFGLGITPDSVGYIEMARLLSGISDSYPALSSHWPPGYALSIALTHAISGTSVIVAARLLHVVLFASATYFLFAIHRQVIGVSLPLVVVAYLFSYPVIVSTMLLSELLFCVLVLAAILAVLKWRRTEDKKYLILCGIFCGIFLLTRYAGLGLIFGFLIIVFSRSSTIRKKLRDSLRLIFPSLVFMALWGLYIGNSEAANPPRSLVFHPIDLNALQAAFETVLVWFTGEVKYALFWPALAMLLGLACYSFLIAYKNKEKLPVEFKKYRTSIMQLGILVVSYFLFLILSISFADAATPLDYRILSPIAFPIFVMGITGVHVIGAVTKSPLTQSLLYTLVALPIIFAGLPKWINHYQQGSQYSSKAGIELYSRIQQYMDNDEMTYYTNAPHFLRFHSLATIKSLPRTYTPTTLELNLNIDDDLGVIKQELIENKAVVIYLKDYSFEEAVHRDNLFDTFEGAVIDSISNGFIIRSKD